MPNLTASLADAGDGVCECCDVESSALIGLIECSDQHAPRLCFRQATQLLRSGDAADKWRARYILVAK
jgi:hypothetical protein